MREAAFVLTFVGAAMILWSGVVFLVLTMTHGQSGARGITKSGLRRIATFIVVIASVVTAAGVGLLVANR